ncbi:MAG: hypothetical protein R3223_12475 [Longimicrobiales bacterium]|nr:hypothetical protein [Longimicrobiales bacterium]
MTRPAADFRRSLASVLLLGALLSLASVGPLRAQSGGEVLETALERYQERMEGVENYTVVQQVMGFESVTYFERTEVDGQSVFVPRSENGPGAAESTPQNPYADFRELADRADREGTEVVNGEESHVVTVTDFEGVDFWNPADGGQMGSFTPERASFYIDTDDYLVRRVTIEGATRLQGEDRDITVTADFRDYRSVDGFVHPFVLDVSVEGLTGGMSPEERRDLEESLEEMRTQLEAMPEQQRQMAERMMSGQMERMETLLSQGTMDMTLQVTEVRVNEGPPESGR